MSKKQYNNYMNYGEDEQQDDEIYDQYQYQRDDQDDQEDLHQNYGYQQDQQEYQLSYQHQDDHQDHQDYQNQLQQHQGYEGSQDYQDHHDYQNQLQQHQGYEESQDHQECQDHHDYQNQLYQQEEYENFTYEDENGQNEYQGYDQQDEYENYFEQLDDQDLQDIIDQYGIQDYIQNVRKPVKRQMTAIQMNKQKVTDFIVNYNPNSSLRLSDISTLSGLNFCINPYQLLQQLIKAKILGEKSFVLEVGYVYLGEIMSSDKSLQNIYKKENNKLNSYEAVQNYIQANKLQGQNSRHLKKKQIESHQIFSNFKEQLFNQQKTQLKPVLLLLMNTYFGGNYKGEAINEFKNRPIQGNMDNLQIYIRYKAEDQIKVDIGKSSQIKTINIDCNLLNQSLKDQQIWQKGNNLDRELIKKKHRERKAFHNQRKKQQNQYKFKELPREVQKKYKIANLNFGIAENDSVSELYSYFDYKRLQNNANASFRHLLMIRKVGEQYKMEITSFLMNRTVIKIEIEFINIEKVKYATATKKVYIHLKSPPKLFMHLMQRTLAFDQYSIGQWHRIENFPIVRNHLLPENNYFLFKKVRSSTILQLSLIKKEDISNFQTVFMTFDGIIETEHIEKSTIFSITQIIKQYQNLWKKFSQAAKQVPEEYSCTVQQIKYQLLCLYQRDYATCRQLVEVLKELQFMIENRKYQQIHYYWEIIMKMPGLDMKKNKLKNKKECKHLAEILNERVQQLIENKMHQQWKESETKDNVMIANLKVTPTGLVISQFSHQMRNRVLKHFSEQQSQFLKIDVMDDNANNLFAVDHLANTYIRQLLDNIKILGKKYSPLAWSQSQLKSNSMWFLREKINEKDITVEEVCNFLGQFSHIKNPALKAARMGQSFSSSNSYDGSLLQVTKINDVKDQFGKYVFSDGIGKIAENVVKEFAAKMDLTNISVLQIRYLGAKGLVVIHPDLRRNQIHLRDSMIKYNCQNPAAKKYLDILGWNNYKVGFINRQIIILLKSCNLQEKNLIDLQNIYLKQIIQIYQEKGRLLNFVRDHLSEGFLNVKKNLINVFKYLLKSDQQFNIENQPFLRGIVRTLQSQALRKLRLKARIKVEKSARIYGILDQFGVLGEQQVYCSIIKPDINNVQQDLQKRQNISGRVVLTRNPCMHPGDIQMVTCVSDEQIKKRFYQIGRYENYFQKYSNCVIFPKKGQIPLTSKISGSDLDGDEFFICWDQTLRPKFQNKDFIADQMTKSSNFTNQCASRQILNFFVEFINNQKLGRLANSHLIHADRNGVHCQQCQKLNELHCLAVDYPKKGYKFEIPRNLYIGQYPHFLEKPYPYRSYYSQSILAKLYDQVNKISLADTSKRKSFLHINKIQLKYTREQYTQALDILYLYQRKIDLAREYYKIKTEFELFCGGENENKKRSSLVMLSNIEQQFQLKFIRLGSDVQFKKPKQKKTEKFLNQISVEGFNQKKKERIQEFNELLHTWELPHQHIRKAILWYIISIVNPTYEQIERTRNNVYKINEDQQKCGYGMVWLCIPNVMLWLYKMGYFTLQSNK